MIKPSTIAEQALYLTVRIETRDAHGNVGVGTGFYFDFALEGTRIPLVVTNKHVVNGATVGTFRVHLRDAAEEAGPNGRVFDVSLDNFQRRWFCHPDSKIDLCAMPVAPIRYELSAKDEHWFGCPTSSLHVWPDTQIAGLDAVENVFMYGYPIGLWDEVNSMPLIRRGITASHPALNYAGRSEFVVDMACFPGSSGSPVLLIDRGAYASKSKEGGLVLQHRATLLGVLYAGPTMSASGEIDVLEAPTGHARVFRYNAMINLGYVIKAKELLVLGRAFADYVKTHHPDKLL